MINITYNLVEKLTDFTPSLWNKTPSSRTRAKISRVPAFPRSPVSLISFFSEIVLISHSIPSFKRLCLRFIFSVVLECQEWSADLWFITANFVYSRPYEGLGETGGSSFLTWVTTSPKLTLCAKSSSWSTCWLPFLTYFCESFQAI